MSVETREADDVIVDDVDSFDEDDDFHREGGCCEDPYEEEENEREWCD